MGGRFEEQFRRQIYFILAIVAVPVLGVAGLIVWALVRWLG